MILCHPLEVDDDAPLPTLRLRSLIHQLIDEQGGAYGAKSQVARVLGLGQAYVSKLIHGQRSNVSREKISEVAATFGLSEEFFYAPGPSDVPYRRFRAGTVSADTPPGWTEWLDGEGGRVQMSADERAALQRMGAAAANSGFPPTPAAYSAWLMSLRMTRLESTTR